MSTRAKKEIIRALRGEVKGRCLECGTAVWWRRTFQPVTVTEIGLTSLRPAMFLNAARGRHISDPDRAQLRALCGVTCATKCFSRLAVESYVEICKLTRLGGVDGWAGNVKTGYP